MRTFPHAQMFGLLASLSAFAGLVAIPSVADASPSASGSLSANVVEGRFETRIADYPDGTSRTSYHVVVGGGQEVEVQFDEDPGLAYDTKVRIEGTSVADGVMSVDDLQVVELPPQPILDPEFRAPRRIATILVFWNGQGLPNAEARESMFSGDRSTQVYYGENSYGMETVVGEVFGPYEIADPGGCNVGAIADMAQAAMQEKGHDPYEFDQFMYHFPGISGCGFAGLASVGSPLFPARDSWYNGSFGCVVRNQEIGHNYGMGHSHAYTCVETDEEGNAGEVPLSTEENCTHIEYGDPYDPMGGGCGHMNVLQKGYMGWLDGCNIVTATTDGVFNLLPVELPCSGTQALRFEAFDGRYYYLEYRQRLGEFDGPSGHDGVLLHIGGEVTGGAPSPYILDVGDNGFLHAGDSYTDERNGVSFTILEESSEGAKIQVNFPNGGNGDNPTCLDGSDPGEEAGAVGSMECAEIPYPADIEAPTVQITYPEDGAVFEAGSSFKIMAEANDNRIISELELYVDGEPMFRLFAEPWEWEVENIPPGEYEFGIAAQDGRNLAPSNVVTITVTDEPVDDGGDTDGGGTTGEDPMGGSDGDTDGGAGQDDEAGDGATDEGCGCSTDGGSNGQGALFALALFGFAFGQRRRR